ncbi:MAG: hypothetical protein H7A10_04895 [Oceanospirillaceae bacterium]|nr:hypothetical protein [Oceanospirillaceae bacterium]
MQHQHTPAVCSAACLTRLRSPLQIPRLPCFLLLAMGCVVLQGCSNYTLEWKEEVKLSDGNVIVVERKAHRKPGGFPDSMRVFISTELSYAPWHLLAGIFGIACTRLVLTGGWVFY